MTDAPRLGVLVGTLVIGWLFDTGRTRSPTSTGSSSATRLSTLAFHTGMELRFGAMRAEWGDFRSRRLERRIAEMTVVQPRRGDDHRLRGAAGRLPADRPRSWRKVHDGDRWIAATALRLGVPLVSHDGVFKDVPVLQLITAAPI
jgi:tRNA(fMet)-specific endonuclease VapC